jgi:hypothetical protein
MREVFTTYIEKEVKDKFLEYCEINTIHKHKLMEKIVKKFLEKTATTK